MPEPRISDALRARVLPYLERAKRTLGQHLGIEFLELTLDRVVATMPVDERTKQPFGLLHGGASVALAESLASTGAWLNIDDTNSSVVGVEINANHIRAVRDGVVTGTATPLHRGRSTQVWETRIVSLAGELVSISRCTLAVVQRTAAKPS